MSAIRWCAHSGSTSMPATATSFRTEAISPIQNKIGKALIEPRLRNMLAQPKSTITLRRLMDEGAIVICNLSKGGLGESTAHLLGRAPHHRIRPGRAVPRRHAGRRSPRLPSLCRRVPIVRHRELCAHSVARRASTASRSPSATSTSTSFPTTARRRVRQCRLDHRLPDRRRRCADPRRADRPRRIPMRCSTSRTSPPGRGCCAAAPRPRRSASTSTTRPAPRRPRRAPADRHQPHALRPAARRSRGAHQQVSGGCA